MQKNECNNTHMDGLDHLKIIFILSSQRKIASA